MNRGLARSEGRWVKPSAGASSERFIARVGLTGKTGEAGPRLRATRDRHPAAQASPKAVTGSWDRDCNGHRILRRVPADRRHLGSSRSVGFHETTTTVILAVFASSDLFHPTKRRTNGEVLQLRGNSERGRMNETPRQRCQRLDRFVTVGRKRPRSCFERRKARGTNPTMSIRRSGLGCRETSGPPILPYGA